jgi:hypothetical protein
VGSPWTVPTSAPLSRSQKFFCLPDEHHRRCARAYKGADDAITLADPLALTVGRRGDDYCHVLMTTGEWVDRDPHVTGRGVAVGVTRADDNRLDLHLTWARVVQFKVGHLVGTRCCSDNGSAGVHDEISVVEDVHPRA